jgi:ribonuclease HI
MSAIAAPHFLLFSESRRRSAKAPPCDWRFVLQSVDGSSRLEATDAEPAVRGERLELLAVVRGLEALDQPSRVTLVTPSKYVTRGLSYGLPDWRENDWNWEHHGQMVPIKNRDLWQRLDRALAFHRVQCRTVPGESPPQPAARPDHCANPCSLDPAVRAELPGPISGISSAWRRRIARPLVRLLQRLGASCRRLKASLAEMESPAGRWRVS